MNAKIAIITCWMGEYPVYFSLWVKSCEKNPHVDWILIADRKPKEELPSNIIFYQMSLSELQTRVKQEMDLDGFGLTSPYKLCDFRPIYGLLFKKELQGYTHWGHCDIDLIWGCFENFLTQDVLTDFDKVFTKGHLGIYKNTEDVNKRAWDKESLYPLSVITESPNFYAFDEYTGMERIYRKKGYPYYKEAPYIDVSVRCQSSFLLNVSEKNYLQQAFYWEDGKVYRVYINEKGEVSTDEWLYLHFQKKSPPNYINDVKHVKAFWIGPNGFYEKTDAQITVSDIENYNPSITEKQKKQEEKAYIKLKLKQFFKKSFKDKCIHIKQRLSRIFF